MQFIANIEKLDLPALAAKVYANQDMATLAVGPYTVTEAVGLVARVIKQLKAELNGADWRHLPHDFTYPAIGSTTLSNCLSTMLSYLQQGGSFNNFIPYLQGLIAYQMQYGFWDRSRLKVHDVKTVELEAKATALATLTKQLDAQCQELEDGRELLATEKTNLQAYY